MFDFRNLFSITILLPGVGLVPLGAPKPEHIIPWRQARAISREGRYANSGDFDYSVAEHCWIVSMLCPDAPLQGLVHDMHEGALGDIIGPLKHMLRIMEGMPRSTLDAMEELWWHSTADRCGVPRVLHPRVEYIDKAIRVVEQRKLFPGYEHLIRGNDDIGPDWLAEQSEIAGLREPLEIRCLSSGEAYELYMDRLRELAPDVAAIGT